MIRMSRGCTLGICSWNIPVIARRVTYEPKQLQKLMEFSLFADKKEESVVTELKRKVLQKKTNETPTQLEFPEFYREIKNKFLKDLLQGGFRNSGSTAQNYDVALKNFFDTLPSHPPSEIIKILKLMADTRNRPIESIKNLCSLLCSHPNWNYTQIECSDVIFSLGMLSHRDEALLNIISKHLKSSDKPIEDIVASKILFSLGELQYRDPDLIEKLMKSLMTRPLSLQYSINCLKALSTLNYSSPSVEKLVDTLSKFQEVDFVKSQDYLNFIWTCVILNKTDLISIEHISKVLSLSFVSRTLNNGMPSPYKWKLLNINAAAKNIPSYKGPFMNDYPHFKVFNMSVKGKSNSFLQSVHDTLTYIIPQTGYMQSLVNTGAGFCLDIEYSWKSNDHNSSQRTGLLLLNYKDICSDGTIAGIPQFKLDILKRLGYNMTVLKYSDFNTLEPLSKKISLLRNKIEQQEESRKRKKSVKANQDVPV